MTILVCNIIDLDKIGTTKSIQHISVQREIRNIYQNLKAECNFIYFTFIKLYFIKVNYILSTLIK